MGCCLFKPPAVEINLGPCQKKPCTAFNTNRSTFFIDDNKSLWKYCEEKNQIEADYLYTNNMAIMNLPPNPYVLKPLSVSRTANTIITSMSLASIDLFEFIRRPFNWDFMCKELKHIADGIHYLHHHGLAHRDIKPENIVLREGHLCLIDWDFCYPIDERMQCGTVHFKCPRTVSCNWNCSSTSFSKKTDVYAFGKLIFAIFWQASFHKMVDCKEFIFNAFHCDSMEKTEIPFKGTWAVWANIAMLCISNNPPESIPVYLAAASTDIAGDTAAKTAEF